MIKKDILILGTGSTDRLDDATIKAEAEYSISFSEQQNKLCFKVVSATYLLVCFLRLKESTFETRKNVVYFTSKALFVLEIIKF